jgi:hypothetical protein
MDALRAKYRSEWDAYQIIAHRNARLAQTGQTPSAEQIADEARAAAEVAKARDALLAAISRLGG